MRGGGGMTSVVNNSNKSDAIFVARPLNVNMALETNEDSSYDSDFETDETCTSHADVSRTSSNNTTHHNLSRCSSTGLSSSVHNDVSRTVSDTLGAEFAEYVNRETLSHNDAEKSMNQPPPPKPSEVVVVSPQESSNNKPSPGYSARVEFGLKLGYSEKLVQAALQKLGPDPSQNELLGELIKLGAQSPRSIESPSASSADDGALGSQASALDPATVQLRPIVIDGSNVAMSHGNKEFFSCRGIKICVDWFVARGHKEITVFVPKWRKESSRPDRPITEQDLLYELERDRILVFTPSRNVGGKQHVCYDDRYILKLAAENDGIVVSNDNYRDLAQENPEFKKIVEERILMYSFVNDLFMPPDDPLGRFGPTLDCFLRVQKKIEPSPRCPYGKKCTYGNKCKFHHPERGNLPQKSVADRLSEHAQKQLQARGLPRELAAGNDLKTHSLPLYDSATPVIRKTPLGRARSAAPAPIPIDPHYHATVASHFNRAQLEQLGNRKMDPPPKSHSIENITSGLKELSFAADPSSYNPYPQPGPWSNMMNRQQQQQQQDAQWAYVENQESNDRNIHRKLQRQLTINPAYDPRLLRMHGCNASALPQSMRNQWSEHQVVSRIASAPAACAAWPSSAAPGASASEPHLHLPPQNIPPQWPWNPPPQTSHQEARNHLHYHLSNIFPEEEVRQAMALFPEETNPQKICAAILSLFPKA